VGNRVLREVVPASVVLVLLAAPCAGAILADGGFESAGCGPWVGFGGWTCPALVRTTGQMGVPSRTGQHMAGCIVSGGPVSGGVLQAFDTTPGRLYQARAWVYTDSWESGPGNPTPANCRMRVGLDPTGGTDCQAASVKWCAWSAGFRGYHLLSVSAQAQSGLMTVFIQAVQSDPHSLNATVADDVEILSGSDMVTDPRITAVAAPDQVVPAQTGIPVSVTIHNYSQSADFRVTYLGLSFWQGTTNVSGYYEATFLAGNPSVVSRGGDATFSLAVAAGEDAPLGPTVVDAYALGEVNLIPNGSFEENTIVPAACWESEKTNTNGTYVLDTLNPYQGLRSYKLSLVGAAFGEYVRAATGSGAYLIAVSPLTDYRLVTHSRQTMTLGGGKPFAVWQQYDANRAQIGSDHVFYPPYNATWPMSEKVVDLTTDYSARYLRFYIGPQAAMTNTSLSCWVDDIRLVADGAPLGVNDPSSADTWSVGAVQFARIADLKSREDGTCGTLADKVVTAVYGDRMYIEEDDRSSGILVAAVGFAEGDRVSVTGCLATENGERKLDQAVVQLAGP